MASANRKSDVDAATADLDFAANTYRIEFDTTLGPIRLDLFPDAAPEHCRNLIGLSRIGYYDGLLFHRVIAGFMIQGGCPSGTGTGGPGYTIRAEFNRLPHEPGTLSMARTNDPNSAGSQFFLCLEKAPHLDRNYTVFGLTADPASLDTVRKIGRVPTGANDRPKTDVAIRTAKVECQTRAARSS
ncbi:MAG: peptidylprolyl isomerase [Planctomycetes bacterium]|nr:peptidylprolyl isomerase [Planctomycetota bacterium]